MSTRQPQLSSDVARFSPIPDPWEALTTEPVTLPPNAWMIPPLDTRHELAGTPAHGAILPHRGAAARANEPIQSAVGILLAHELKLPHGVDRHLNEEIGDAIAWLELATEPMASVSP